MNLLVFPNQRGSHPFVREGAGARTVGLVFRLPEEFDHVIRYIGEGRIYHQEGAWKFRGQKQTGRWELGWGTEPFQTWMERQFARLRQGARILGAN